MNRSQHLLNQTNGGLNIFGRYINHNFAIGESFEKGQERFTILWSEQYQNYILRHERLDGKRWRWYQNYNAIYFLQEKFGLTKTEVFEMLVREMNLTVAVPNGDKELTTEKINENEF